MSTFPHTAVIKTYKVKWSTELEIKSIEKLDSAQLYQIANAAIHSPTHGLSVMLPSLEMPVKVRAIT